MNITPVYYYEPENPWRERVRAVAREAAMSLSAWLDKLPLPQALASLRDDVSEALMSLWVEWVHHSPEEVMMAVNGELPLFAINDFARAHFVDFDSLHWYCIDCFHTCQTVDAIDDHCPHCDDGNLYQCDDGMWRFCLEQRAKLANLPSIDSAKHPIQSQRLLLTERRAV